MYCVASQRLLVDSIMHGRESSSVIGDPDARHVATFCVSTSIRTSRERSIEWRIRQENQERWQEIYGEDEADRTNPDDRDIVRVYANVISLAMRRRSILALLIRLINF